MINSRRKKPQERKTSSILHNSEPDGRWKWYGRSATRLDETKDRSIQEYLETPSKYGVLVQLEARSRGRLAILLNTVTCSRSLQHTTCSLHWESGMFPESARFSADVHAPTTTIPRFTNCCGHRTSVDRCRMVQTPQAIPPWIIEFLEYFSRQSSSRIQHVKTRSRSWWRSSRTTSTRNHSFRTWERRRWSTSSANNRKTWSPIWPTPRSSNFAKILPKSNVQSAMLTGKPVLIYCSCGRNIEIFAETRVRAEQPRRHLNPWQCYQEEQQSRCQTRTFWTTKTELPGETDAEKGPSEKARTPSNDTFTMVRRRRTQRFVCQPSGGKKNTWCCTTELPWRNICTSPTRAGRIQT